MTKTYMAKPQEVQRSWYLLDADGQTVGRLASEIAKRLRGKHKPEYTPHVDTGDYIVVINADKIHISGNKNQDKYYYHHTGFPGGIKSQSFNDLKASKPEQILEKAVKGMIPRGPLGRQMLKKLKIYAGTEHKHEAQQPKPLNIMDE